MDKSEQLHEINRYDDNSFPFEMYSVSKEKIVPQGRGYKDLHWHEELQFTLVISGTMSIQIYDTTYELKEGEAIFINSGLLHMTTMLSTDGRYVSFNFPERMLGFFAGSRMEQKYVLPYTRNKGLLGIKFSDEILWQKRILSKLFDMKALKERSFYLGKEYELSTIIVGLWFEIIKHVDETIEQPHPSWIKKQRRMQTFLGYIHRNYVDEIHLENIAASAHVSVGECGRCFKSVLNMTPNEYLINFRINRSMDLLNETDHTITEIATAVGFNYVGHYIQHFKKRIGQTPNQYRNNHWKE